MKKNMQEVTDLIACEECDAIHRKLALGHNEVTLCGRCGAALEQDMSVHSRRALPLTIASLLMFVIANVFPIVELQFQGHVNRTTIIGALLSLERRRNAWRGVPAVGHHHCISLDAASCPDVFAARGKKGGIPPP